MNGHGKTAPTVLVLGIGNLIMSDDGVGVVVVQRLQREYRLPPEVDVMDGGTLGLDILPRLEGIERLIVVDAVETGGSAGTCVRLTGDEIPLALETKISPHQTGLKDLLTVAGLMGHAPREMVLVGVQPGSIEMGTDLTTEVAAQVDAMLAAIVHELRQWGMQPTPL
ncbi:MAG TPA: HyaD/HybD family hydrogenase maturation endopeptidase [Geobacteraceae bacterium]